MAKPFNVAFTGDFYDAAGQPKYADLGLAIFDASSAYQSADVRRASQADQRADQLAGRERRDRAHARGDRANRSRSANDLLAIGRFGVGYDAVDVAACTDADVVVVHHRRRGRSTGGRSGRRLDDRADASHASERPPRARRQMGRSQPLHGPRAARSHARRDRPGRDRAEAHRAARRVGDEAAGRV